MPQQINKWIVFFQGLIYQKFRQSQPEAISVLTEWHEWEACGA